MRSDQLYNHETYLGWLLMFGPIQDLFVRDHRVVENRCEWRVNFKRVMGRDITYREQENYDAWCRRQEVIQLRREFDNAD